MNKISVSTAAGVVAGLAVLASSPVLATEGYFSNGYGVVNKSMAGAGVATGFDAMSQATNPAALTLINPQFTADLSVFSPRREATLAGAGVVPGTYESDRNYFFVPSLAGAYEIDATSTWGWAIYGNGGMNTTYDDPSGPFGGGKTGVDLAQLFIQGTYAREVSPGFSVGIGPVIAAQRFKAFGLAPFGVANNDYDYSYGFGGRIGFQADLVSGLRFGASYQTKMFMSEFDDYADLFAEQGDFDIPSALQAGISWEPTSGLTLSADWKRIWYSDVASVSNTFFAASPLGADDGPGFGWDDVDTFKLGVAWEANSTITVRVGASLNNNPIPDEEVLFNVLAPGVQEQHYTAGLGWKLDASNTINFGAMYSPSNSVTGPNPNGGGDITIEMYQWEATVGWAWTF